MRRLAALALAACLAVTAACTADGPDVELSATTVKAPDFDQRPPDGSGRPVVPGDDSEVEGNTDSLAQDLFTASVEDTFTELSNKNRRVNGIPELVTDDALVKYARAHAAAMAATNSIWHSDIASLLTGYWAVGENVGVGPDAPSITQAYERSPGHYANMTSPDWTVTGVGAWLQHGRVWAVQVFAT